MIGGVPQGPILFIIYINYLEKEIGSNIIKCLDDTTNQDATICIYNIYIIARCRYIIVATAMHTFKRLLC